jgi:hypothetical protein
MAGVGDQLLLRYFYENGGHQAALPVRVVEDSADRLGLWLADGTEIMYWATHDGRDLRSLPLTELFATPLATAPRHWTGGGVLRVLLPETQFQVLHFWDLNGSFSHWYVNFEASMKRHGSRVDTVDWHLDLVIDADGTGRWKDEDEAIAAVHSGQLDQSRLAEARAIGTSILKEFPSILEPVGDWRNFRAPVDWTALQLPADWDL